jgi:hypothetical protein
MGWREGQGLGRKGQGREAAGPKKEGRRTPRTCMVEENRDSCLQAVWSRSPLSRSWTAWALAVLNWRWVRVVRSCVCAGGDDHGLLLRLVAGGEGSESHGKPAAPGHGARADCRARGQEEGGAQSHRFAWPLLAAAGDIRCFWGHLQELVEQTKAREASVTAMLQVFHCDDCNKQYTKVCWLSASCVSPGLRSTERDALPGVGV